MSGHFGLEGLPISGGNHPREWKRSPQNTAALATKNGGRYFLHVDGSVKAVDSSATRGWWNTRGRRPFLCAPSPALVNQLGGGRCSLGRIVAGCGKASSIEEFGRLAWAAFCGR